VSTEILQPSDWAPPRGYVNGIATRGRLVFVAGQIGWNERGAFTSERLADQARQALANISRVLAEAGGGPQHTVRLTWYVTDLQAYREQIKEIGAAYRDVFGRHFPTMTLVGVAGLVEPKAVVEIEATAVIPD
jgi:enamine deaminase RidA (YjgF/YER057c/UK114 family)